MDRRGGALSRLARAAYVTGCVLQVNGGIKAWGMRADLVTGAAACPHRTEQDGNATTRQKIVSDLG